MKNTDTGTSRGDSIGGVASSQERSGSARREKARTGTSNFGSPLSATGCRVGAAEDGRAIVEGPSDCTSPHLPILLYAGISDNTC